MQWRIARSGNRSQSERLSDLDPDLFEFEHLMDAERFDDACRLLNEIDCHWLALGGQSEMIVERRTRLLGRIEDGKLESLNCGNLMAIYLKMCEGQPSAYGVGEGPRIGLDLGDQAAAELLFRRLSEVEAKDLTLGPEDPDTLLFCNEHATDLRKSG